MRNLVILTGVLALAACSKPAPAPTAETTEAATPTAVASGPPAGTYDVTMADGSKGQTTINADGTYLDVAPDKTETKGAVATKNGKTCFDPTGDAPEMCWADGTPAADGSWVATSDKGDKVTVKKIEAAATAK